MTQNDSPGGPQTAAAENPGSTATIIYILYLASLIVGITMLIGVVMAYLYRGRGPAWVEAHYQFQIRTFWIGLLYGIVCSLLTVVTFGFAGILFLGLALWWIVRCVKGMMWIGERRGPNDPASWWLG